MSRSHLLSQIAGCSAMQALTKGQYSSQWPLLISAANVARGLATDTSSSSSDSSSSTAVQKQQEYPPLYAACVLERLPIVKAPVPADEAEAQGKLMLLQLQSHKLKQYPSLDTKQRDAGGKEQTAAADTAASTTAADASGAVNTMKRRLHDKLVLLVKAQSNALKAAAAAAAAEGDSQASGSSSSSSSSWTFPHTAHQPGETMRQAAERALKETIGLSQVYFVGNAPMAHLNVRGPRIRSQSSTGSSDASVDSSSSSSSSEAGAGKGTSGSSGSSSSKGPRPPTERRVFFHLAQVVNDPWDVQLLDGVAADYAWVSKDELEQYITDSKLLALARKMM